MHSVSMHTVRLGGRGSFSGWRDAARGLLLARVEPEKVTWLTDFDAPDDLFGGDLGLPGGVAAGDAAVPVQISVPRDFIPLAESVVCHSQTSRFALLYRLLWRLQEERHLLEIRTDTDVAQAAGFEKSVRRDSHKMKAFVRFREIVEDIPVDGRRKFVAWFEPDHYIVGRTAGFFQRRFTDMDWAIFTPYGSSVWDGENLTVSDAPCEKPLAEDLTDNLWRTYYANIFNPARLKVKAMQSEMPKKYWKNLPEASLIPHLIAGAGESVLKMVERQPTMPPVRHRQMQVTAQRLAPEISVATGSPLEMLAGQASACTRCPLHAGATQTVCGEGPADARIMFVGEQAGDHEDLAGKPFIGPAGKLLDHVLANAGIDRSACFVTNAVKHFKYKLQGKRRIHQRPSSGEISHCRWWLHREIELVRPKVIVALGATALEAITGERGNFSQMRGQMVQLDEHTQLLVTIHPAYLLRIPDPALKHAETQLFQQHIELLERVSM